MMLSVPLQATTTVKRRLSAYAQVLNINQNASGDIFVNVYCPNSASTAGFSLVVQPANTIGTYYTTALAVPDTSTPATTGLTFRGLLTRLISMSTSQ
jgi:hypothetical protein